MTRAHEALTGSQTQSTWLRERGTSLLIAAFLAAVAWLAARNYVLSDLIIWGDHPGQFMRFWYPTAVSLPQYGRFVDWNPLWYAGYPELQFYPPGHALLGVVLRWLSLGSLSPERAYNLIPAIALALPVFTCYAFLRYTLAGLGRGAARVAGMAAGLLTLAFMPMWGGTFAAQIGLMGERLAFGVAPLALLAGWKLVERPGYGRLAAVAALLSAMVLLHPFHAPAVVIAVALFALIRHGALRREAGAQINLGRTAAWLVAWVSLAVALTAWWLLPLALRQSPYAAALMRASLPQTLDWFKLQPVVPGLLAGALLALPLLAHRDPRVRATVAALALLIPTLVLIVLFDHAVLIARLGITALDPIRFIAEYYLAFILLTGAAAGAVTSRFLWRIPPLALLMGFFLVAALVPIGRAFADYGRAPMSVPFESTLPGINANPSFAGLWDALRNDPAADGRVLYTSYYYVARWPNGASSPTAIKSMTPMLTGREIIGGTFSHWSPGARLLWVGDPWARLLPAQVEAEDDQRIFGVPWKELTDAQLLALTQALNITTVVADADDVNAKGMLDFAPSFERAWDNGAFTTYRPRGATSQWVDAQGATVQLVSRGARRWEIRVDAATEGATLRAKQAVYPLWRARADGQPLSITADENGLQRIALPAGGPYTVTLTYEEGWPEWGGLAVSVLAAALMLATWARAARRGRRAAYHVS